MVENGREVGTPSRPGLFRQSRSWRHGCRRIPRGIPRSSRSCRRRPGGLHCFRRRDRHRRRPAGRRRELPASPPGSCGHRRLRLRGVAARAGQLRFGRSGSLGAVGRSASSWLANPQELCANIESALPLFQKRRCSMDVRSPRVTAGLAGFNALHGFVRACSRAQQLEKPSVRLGVANKGAPLLSAPDAGGTPRSLQRLRSETSRSPISKRRPIPRCPARRYDRCRDRPPMSTRAYAGPKDRTFARLLSWAASRGSFSRYARTGRTIRPPTSKA